MDDDCLVMDNDGFIAQLRRCWAIWIGVVLFVVCHSSERVEHGWT